MMFLDKETHNVILFIFKHKTYFLCEKNTQDLFIKVCKLSKHFLLNFLMCALTFLEFKKNLKL